MIDDHDPDKCTIIRRSKLYIEFLKMYPVPDTIMDDTKFTEDYIEDAIYMYDSIIGTSDQYSFQIYLFYVYCKNPDRRKFIGDMLRETVDEPALRARYEENDNAMDSDLEIAFNLVDDYPEVMRRIRDTITIAISNIDDARDSYAPSKCACLRPQQHHMPAITEDDINYGKLIIENITRDLSKDSRHEYMHKAVWAEQPEYRNGILRRWKLIPACWPSVAAARHIYGRMTE